MSLEKLEIYNVKKEAISSDNESSDNIQRDSNYVSTEIRNQSINQSKASPSQRRKDISSRSPKNVPSSPKSRRSSSRSFQASPKTEHVSPKKLHTSPRRSQKMSPRQSTSSSWYNSPTSTLSTRNSTRNNSPVTSSTSSPSTTQHSPSTRQSTPSISPIIARQNTEGNEHGDSDSDIRIEKDKIVIKINLKNINQKTESKKKKKKRKKRKKSKEKSTKNSKIYSNVSVNIESNMKYSLSSEKTLEEQERSNTVEAVESSLHTLGLHEQPIFSTNSFNSFAIRKNDGAIKINSGVVVNNTHGKYSLRNSTNKNTRLSQKILQLTHETLHMNYNNSLLTNNNSMIAKQLSCTNVTQMKDSIHEDSSSIEGFQNGMISNLAMFQQRRARLSKCKSVREMLLESASMEDLQYTSDNHTNSNDLNYLDRFNNNSKVGCDMNNMDSLGSLERLAEDCIDLTEEDAELDNDEFIDFHALETLIPYETYLQNVRNGEDRTASIGDLRSDARSHAEHNKNIIKVSPKSKTNKVRNDPIGNFPKIHKQSAATITSKTAKKRANVVESRDVMLTGTSTRTMTKVKVPNRIRIDKTFCEIREIQPPPSSDAIELIEPNSESQIRESNHYSSHEQTRNQSNEPSCTNVHTAQHYLQKEPLRPPNGPVKTMPKPNLSHLSSTNNEQDDTLPTNRICGKHKEYYQPSSNKLCVSPLLRSQTNLCQTKEINSSVKDSVLRIDVNKHTKHPPNEIRSNSIETSVMSQSSTTEGLVLRSNKTKDVSKDSTNVPKDNGTIISKSKDDTLAKLGIPLKQSIEEASTKIQIECDERSIDKAKPQRSPKDVDTFNVQNNFSLRQEICDLSKETTNESKTNSPTRVTDEGVNIMYSNPNIILETSQDEKTNTKEPKEDLSESPNVVLNSGDNLQKVAKDRLGDLEQNSAKESSSQETLFEALNLFKDRNHLCHSKQKKQNEINNLLLELDRLDNDEDGNRIEDSMPTLKNGKDITVIKYADKKVSDKKNSEKSSGVEPGENSAEKYVEQASVVHVNTTMPNPLERAINLISKLNFTLTSKLDATSIVHQESTVQETTKSYRPKKLLKELENAMNTGLDGTEMREGRKEAKERKENEVLKEDTVVKRVEDHFKPKEHDQEAVVRTPKKTRKSERIQKLQKEPDMSKIDVKTSDTLPVTETPESEDGIDGSAHQKVQSNITKDIVSSSIISEDILEASKKYVELYEVDNKAINDGPTEILTTVKTHRRSARLNKDSSEIVEKDDEFVGISNKDNLEKINEKAKSVEIINIDKDNIEKIHDVNELKRITKNKSETSHIDAKTTKVLESAKKPNITTRELRPRKRKQKRSIMKSKKKTKLERMKIRAKSVKSKASKLGKGLRKTEAKINVNKSCTMSNTAKPITEIKRMFSNVSTSDLDPTVDISTDRINKICRRSCSSNIESKIVTSATMESAPIGINRDSLRQSVRQSVEHNIEAAKMSSCTEPKTETTLTSISIGASFSGIVNRDSLRQCVRESIDSHIDSEKNKSCTNQRPSSSDIPISYDEAVAQKSSIDTSTVTNTPRNAVKKKIHVMLERKKKRRKRKQKEEHIRNNELNNNLVPPLSPHFENEDEIETVEICIKTRTQKDAMKQTRINERRSEENILQQKYKKSGKTKPMEVSGKIATKETKQPQRKLSPRFNIRNSAYVMQNRLRQSVRLQRRTSLKQNERNLNKQHMMKNSKELSITKSKPLKKKNKVPKKEYSNVVNVKKEWEVSSVSNKKRGKKENTSKYHKTICKNVNETKNEDVNSEYKDENEIQREIPTKTKIKEEKSESKQELKEIKIKSEKNVIVEIHNAITEQILKKKREKLNKDISISEPNKQAEKAKRGRPPKDGRTLKLKVELVEMNNIRQADVYDFEDDLETAGPPVKKHCKDPERSKETLNEPYGKSKRTKLEVTENSIIVEKSGNNDQESSKKKLRGRPPKVVSEGLIKLKTELVENNKFVQNNLYNYQDHLESKGTQLLMKKIIKKEPGLTKSRFNNCRSGLIDDEDDNTLKKDQQTDTSKTKSTTYVIEQTAPNQSTTQDKMNTRNNKTKQNGGNIKVNKGNLYKIIQNIKSEIKEKNLIKSETKTPSKSVENEKQDLNVGNVSKSVHDYGQNNVSKDTNKTHSDTHKVRGTSGPVLDMKTYNQISTEEKDVEQSSKQFNAELLNSMKIKKEQLQYYASQASGLPNITDEKVDQKKFLQKCPLCEKIFRSLFRMKQHLRKVHAGQLFDCDCCNETFIDKQLYEDHMTSHDDGIDCKFCGGKFTKDNIRDHLVFHIQADQRGRISDGCFNRKQTSLLTHFLTKNNFKLQCHLCDDTFCPRSNMLRHYSTKHTDEKIYYTCEQCNKRFSLLQNLKRHLAIHEGITYECNLCDRKYSRLSDYKIHLNIHNGMKYQCPICFKCTSRPSYLKKHMIMLHQRQDYNVLTDLVGVGVEKS